MFVINLKKLRIPGSVSVLCNAITGQSYSNLERYPAFFNISFKEEILFQPALGADILLTVKMYVLCRRSRLRE